MVRFIAAGLVIACSSKTPTSSTSPTESETTPSTTTPTTTETFTAPPAQVVQFDTSDGVTLEADWYPTEIDGGPAFVLLHMIPPNNDRTNWPASFIDRLVAQQWAVLAVDRRGAGGSGGMAQEAYEGENGKLDVAAAAGFLADAGYGDLALIGASNGTTSVLDYTVWAEGEGLPVPVGVGFMTGGTYTENQNLMPTMPMVPAVFTYSTAERAWSVDQEGLNPGSWSFLEYDGGAHGTRMFDAKPRVRGDLVDFFAPLF